MRGRESVRVQPKINKREDDHGGKTRRLPLRPSSLRGDGRRADLGALSLHALPEDDRFGLFRERAFAQREIQRSGPLKAFDDIGDSGKPLKRWFCSQCGSPIWTEADAMPDTAIVKASAFDDTSWIKPTLEIFCDSRQAWTPKIEGLASFAKMPG